MHEPLLWHHLPFGTDGLARNADPRSLDDLGASGEQAGSRASERVVTEAVDLRPTAGCRAAPAVAEGEWHAQAAAERELHGLVGRKRRGWLGWYGSEPGPCMRPRLGPHQRPGIRQHSRQHHTVAEILVASARRMKLPAMWPVSRGRAGSLEDLSPAWAGFPAFGS